MQKQKGSKRVQAPMELYRKRLMPLLIVFCWLLILLVFSYVTFGVNVVFVIVGCVVLIACLVTCLFLGGWFHLLVRHFRR